MQAVASRYGCSVYPAVRLPYARVALRSQQENTAPPPAPITVNEKLTFDW